MKKILLLLVIITALSGCDQIVTPEFIPTEIVFNLSAITREDTTEIYIDYPVLTIAGIDYSLDYPKDLNVSVTDEYIIINLQIGVDFTDSFCFVNNNAYNIYGIDLTTVTIEQMVFLLTIWFPERYLPPEPEIPFYSETRFNLSGYGGAVSDHLTVHEESLQTGIDYQVYADHAVYMGDIRKIVLSMTTDNKDSFLFVNGNMLNFFNIDMQSMSYSELIITADILNRYPEETVWVLAEEYNP